MSDKETTTFDNKCLILGELWIDYRTEPDLEDFVQYNDLGLPLGFMLAEGLITPTKRAEQLIDETWAMLLVAFGIEEDTGFTSFEELMLG